MFHKDDLLRVVNIPLVLSNYFALMITWISICALSDCRDDNSDTHWTSFESYSSPGMAGLGCLLSTPSVPFNPIRFRSLTFNSRHANFFCRLYLFYVLIRFIHSCIYARSDGCGATDRVIRRVVEICNNCAWNATRRKFLRCNEEERRVEVHGD